MEYSVATSKGQVMIPRALRKKYGIKPGTKVAFIDKDGEIVLQALTKDYFDSFAGILKGDVIGELMKEKQKEKEL